MLIQDTQFVTLDAEMGFPSPYRTETFRLSYSLRKGWPLERWIKKPHLCDEGTMACGPYSDLPPYEFGPVSRIHYAFHDHLGYFPMVKKDITVSHWGSVAVEERYNYQHESQSANGWNG